MQLTIIPNWRNDIDMIVCICNAYRTAQIEATARETGHCDAYAVYEALGAGPRCGRCLEMAQDIVDEVQGTCSPRRMAAE